MEKYICLVLEEGKCHKQYNMYINLLSSAQGEGGYSSDTTESKPTPVNCPKIKSYLNDSSYQLRSACGYYFRFIYFYRKNSYKKFMEKLLSTVQNNALSDITISTQH
jgi:hypothetical protein